MPTDSAPTEILPPVRVFKNVLKPSAGLPRRFSWGIRRFSKKICLVSDAFQPIFFSNEATESPGFSVSIMKAPIPSSFPSMMALAVTVMSPATPAFVVKILLPLITHSSPSRTAVVLVAPASLPASGSVSPKAPIISPEARRGRYFCFCSSDPAKRMGVVPRDV